MAHSPSLQSGHEGHGPKFDVHSLKRLLKAEMRRSRRGGYWFRLDRLERSICSLAFNLRIKMRSAELVRALVSILNKLKRLGEGARGARLALVFSNAAARWGNSGAPSWCDDGSYAAFLGRFMAAGR